MKNINNKLEDMQDGDSEAQTLGLGCTWEVCKSQGSWNTPWVFSGNSNANLSWGTSDMEDMNSMIWKILKDVDI